MDKLEDLHADRIYMSFYTMKAVGKGWDPVKLSC